jgi:exopolyphosphatase/pppGpp-phosphohydrolase
MNQHRHPDLRALESELAAVAQEIERDAHAPADWTLLFIGDEELGVLGGGGDGLSAVNWLDIGPARIANQYFHHDPPMSQEVERAIDFVEDEIMRLGRPEQPAPLLWSASPVLRAWGAVAGPHMIIESVETWFQRLASVSLGQPGAMAGLPEGREAAAVLLVLREFMHHRGHASITVLNSPDDTSL